MRSATPKVLHEVGGRSLARARRSRPSARLEPEHLVVVVGHGREQVTAHLAEIAPDAADRRAGAAERHRSRGARRARRARRGRRHARRRRPGARASPATRPLLTGETLRGLRRHARGAGRPRHRAHRASLDDPTGYGRVAARRATARHRRSSSRRTPTTPSARVREINSGVYAFDVAGAARRARPPHHRQRAGRGVPHRRPRAARRGAALPVAAVVGRRRRRDPRRQRPRPARRRPARCCATASTRAWMRAGVTIVDPATTWIDVDVDLEPDCVVRAQHRAARAAPPSRRAPSSGPTPRSPTSWSREGASVVRTPGAERAEIGAGRHGRPVHLPAARAPCSAAKAKLGAYVETKNAVVGDGSKVPHLSYVGDAEIGEGSNIGAGHDHRQLRRRRQAPHRRRRPRADRQRHDARRAGDRSATAPTPRPARSSPTTCRRARWPSAAPASATSRAGSSAAPGSAAPPRRPPRPRTGLPDGDRRPVIEPRTRSSPVTGIVQTSQKRLVLIAGRSHPELAQRRREGARRRPRRHAGVRLRQRRDLRAVRGVGARLRRVRAAEPHRRRSTSGSWSS